MFKLRQETPEDSWEVEALLDSAFGTERLALSSYRLRTGVSHLLALSAVAHDQLGILCGAIRFWPVKVGMHDSLLLGPIAVHPTRQGEGLGGILMRAGLHRAERDGWQHVLLVGDAPYYRRFGFAVAADIHFPPPTDPQRVLYLSLGETSTQAITGRVSKWKQPAE